MMLQLLPLLLASGAVPPTSTVVWKSAQQLTVINAGLVLFQPRTLFRVSVCAARTLKTPQAHLLGRVTLSLR